MIKNLKCFSSSSIFYFYTSISLQKWEKNLKSLNIHTYSQHRIDVLQFTQIYNTNIHTNGMYKWMLHHWKHVWIFYNFKKERMYRKKWMLFPTFFTVCAGMMMNGFVATKITATECKKKKKRQHTNLQRILLIVAFKLQLKKENCQKKIWSFIGVIDKVAERNEKVKMEYVYMNIQHSMYIFVNL